jgi:hypothetical protein
MSTRNLPAADTYGWQPHRHLWADCIENVGASTSHNPMDLHGLLLLIINRSSFSIPTRRSRESVVGITAGYGLEDRGGRSSSPGRVKNFLFSTSSRSALGSTQPPIQWVSGALSPGVKRPGREAKHLPPASAGVMKMWIYTSIPHTLSWSGT